MNSTSFLPKNMQFKGMNSYYKDGMNPWAILHYGNVIIVSCGSKEEYKRLVLDKHELPVEVIDYILDYKEDNPDVEIYVLVREYPENYASSMTVKLPDLEFDYQYDF